MHHGIRAITILGMVAAILSACSSSPSADSTNSAPERSIAVSVASSRPALSSSATTTAAAPTTTAASSTPPPVVSVDLDQLAAGNYTSLLGTWTEVAHAINPHDGGGEQWRSRGTDTLSVSSTTLVNAPQGIRVQGKASLSGSGSDTRANPLVFQNKGKYLEALLLDQEVAINLSFGFYPRGTVDLNSHLTVNNGVQLDNSKNTIYIWSSNGGYAEVFSQTVAAPAPQSGAAPHAPDCLTEAGFTRVLATSGVTVTQLVYCGQGLALTGTSDCHGGVCNAGNEVFYAAGDRWTVSTKEALCDYANDGANSPIPSKYQWYCSSG